LERLTIKIGENVSYFDTLNEMNLDQSESEVWVEFTFRTSRDVNVSGDVEEHNILVNKTNCFNAWWELMNLPPNAVALSDFVQDTTHYHDFNEYPLDPEDEEYSFAEDCAGALQAVREYPGDLFDFAEVEVIQHDHKRGELRGSWIVELNWDLIRDCPEVWEWAEKYRSNLEVSVNRQGEVLTLAS
jgi:hypothetical protein